MMNKTNDLHPIAPVDVCDCLEHHADEDPATVEYESISTTIRMRYSNILISREKRCSDCAEWLTTGSANFAPDAGTANGDSSRCRKCAAKASRIWRKANLDKARAQRARNYKRLKQAGPDLTRQEKDELKAEANHSCLDRGKHETELDRPLEFDYVTPLSKDGSNAKWNRECLCHADNLKKGCQSTDFLKAKRKVAA